ncbi:MAG TPA: HK97 family phage prohead protease [Chitinophagaceae bacterium]|nr:HK97 family phage prohead protease [Chitinophagaceae bacterium]HND96138.1 HK97 family phage prohead protease [Chitinophagaceae bacterium]
MEKKYIYKDSLVSDSLRLQIKDVDGKKGIVTGYFSDFNSIDSDGDIIKPGAFQKSISQNGPQSSKPRIKHLLNHDSSKPLGVLEVLKEDTKGLYYESRLGTHSLGVDFIKMVDSGLISEHSIGFQTVKYNQLKPWNEWKQGEAARELTELKLYEGSSLTAWGANMNTPLTGLKTEQKVRKINDRIDILIKSLRDGTFSDETFDLLEIELKQMQQAMIDLTTEPEQTTQSDEEKAVADIKQFLKTLN